MPLSSSSFFHFTSNLDAFKSILETGFRVSPSIEIRDRAARVLNGGEAIVRTALAVPMVCFCDIPVSLVKNHASVYGKKSVYGFGLNREWGIKNGCEPVIYGHTKDRYQDISDWLRVIYREEAGKPEGVPDFWNNAFFKVYTDREENELDSSRILMPEEMWYPKTDLLYKLARGKNYGRDSFPDAIDSNYSFYDEREWRFVPSSIKELPYYREVELSHPKLTFSLIGDLEKRQFEWFKKQRDSLIGRYENLKFCADDITFLIVDTDENAKTLVEWLMKRRSKSIGGNIGLTSSGRNLLISKIISYQTIESDIFHL